MFGESEINELNDEGLWIYQNILGFDIAMHDSLFMQKFKSVTKLVRYVTNFLIVQVSPSGLLYTFVK